MGFFPFQIVSRSSARPVGGPLSDYHGLILDEVFEIDARHLLRLSGLKSWEFNHLVASQRTFQPYHEIEDISFVINLSNGVDSYLREQRDSGSKLVQSINWKRRKPEREIGPIDVAEGNVSLYPFSRILKTLGQRPADVIRKTPLALPARLPARIIRRYSQWKNSGNVAVLKRIIDKIFSYVTEAPLLDD